MQVASRASQAEVVGEVNEVDPMAKSLVVQSNSRVKGARELNVEVAVTDTTSIKEGTASKRFDDIRVGDKIWMKYERKGKTLIAESIRIKSHAE